MDSKIRNALFIAGAILVAAAIIAMGKFENSNLIVSTIMVVIAVGLVIFGYNKDKERLKSCLKEKPKSNKALGITFLLVTVFLGLGFAVGKLIYLWSQQL